MWLPFGSHAVAQPKGHNGSSLNDHGGLAPSHQLALIERMSIFSLEALSLLPSCPKCGYLNAEGASFCQSCGTPLVSRPISPPSSPTSVPYYEVPPRRGMTSGEKVVIAVVILVAIIVVGGTGLGVLLLLLLGQPKQRSPAYLPNLTCSHHGCQCRDRLREFLRELFWARFPVSWGDGFTS